jgi:hypothetical protein
MFGSRRERTGFGHELGAASSGVALIISTGAAFAAVYMATLGAASSRYFAPQFDALLFGADLSAEQRDGRAMAVGAALGFVAALIVMVAEVGLYIIHASREEEALLAKDEAITSFRPRRNVVDDPDAGLAGAKRKVE